jgi:hypothetical protein
MKRASPFLHSRANFGTRRTKRASRSLPYGGAEVLGAPLRGETRKRRAVVGLACLIDRFDGTEKCERGPGALLQWVRTPDRGRWGESGPCLRQRRDPAVCNTVIRCMRVRRATGERNGKGAVREAIIQSISQSIKSANQSTSTSVYACCVVPSLASAGCLVAKEVPA